MFLSRLKVRRTVSDFGVLGERISGIDSALASLV